MDLFSKNLILSIPTHKWFENQLVLKWYWNNIWRTGSEVYEGRLLVEFNGLYHLIHQLEGRLSVNLQNISKLNHLLFITPGNWLTLVSLSTNMLK